MQDDQNQTQTEEVAQEAPVEEAKVAEAPKEEPKAEEKKAEPKEEKKATKSVPKKLEGLMSDIEKLSVLELSELVHALEEKFGVSAAAGVAVAAAPAGGAAAGAGEGADEGQTTFNVVLTDSGANKISVIKAIRELVPTLGLKEAKDIADAPPKNILEGANKENANEAKTKLEAAGAKVELK